MAMHVPACDVHVNKMTDNNAALVQIYTSHEEKHSYSQGDVSVQLERDFVVIFQGFTRTQYNVSAGSH